MLSKLIIDNFIVRKMGSKNIDPAKSYGFLKFGKNRNFLYKKLGFYCLFIFQKNIQLGKDFLGGFFAINLYPYIQLDETIETLKSKKFGWTAEILLISKIPKWKHLRIFEPKIAVVSQNGVAATRLK